MSSAGRLVGLDIARCLALLGMVTTHLIDERGLDGELTFGQWLAGGRASALFAVLAGVALALSTGRHEPSTGRERAARSAGLAVRALLIAAIGFALGELESGLAVILVYYAVLFVLGLPFLGLRAPWLLALAGVWAVVAPLISHLIRPELPVRRYDVPVIQQLGDPGPLLSELLFTGYYPAVPWLAYLLLGIGLGRLRLDRRVVQASVAATGLVLAVGATLLSRVLVAGTDLTAEQLDGAASGMFGTTPTGEGAHWLLVVAPHSATPFDLLQTGGSAMLVVGGCLLLVGALPALPARALQVLFGAGAMTLSLYSLHAWLRTPERWSGDDPNAYRNHVLVLLLIGVVYAALGWRGPLERAVGWCSSLMVRWVRGGEAAEAPSARRPPSTPAPPGSG